MLQPVTPTLKQAQLLCQIAAKNKTLLKLGKDSADSAKSETETHLDELVALLKEAKQEGMDSEAFPLVRRLMGVYKIHFSGC